MKITPAKGERKRQIIHIADYHFVDEQSYALDIRDVAKGEGVTLTDAEVYEQWEAFRDDVEAVQGEQMGLLRSLVASHGLKAVYLEGLAPKDTEALKRRVDLLRDIKPRTGERPLDLLLNDIHRNNLVRIGTLGRLMMTGEIEVLPCEDCFVDAERR